MKLYFEPFVNTRVGRPSKMDSRQVRNPFESVVPPRVLSHALLGGMAFTEPSPSVGILAVRPRWEAFAVACSRCQDLDNPDVIWRRTGNLKLSVPNPRCEVRLVFKEKSERT